MSDIEMLAEINGRGIYDLPWETRVVRRKGKAYLVHDFYCGERELRGGMYRPFVYEVPEGLVDLVVELVANGAEYDDRYEAPTSKIAVLEYEYIGGDKLKHLGELGKLNWTREL